MCLLIKKLCDENMWSLKYVLFECEQPMLFVVEDIKGNYFLCDMCDDRDGMKWLAIKVNETILKDMMWDKCSVRTPFEQAVARGRLLAIVYKNGSFGKTVVEDFEAVELDLPQENFYFEADITEKNAFLDAFGLADKIKVGDNGEYTYKCRRPPSEGILKVRKMLLQHRKKCGLKLKGA